MFTQNIQYLKDRIEEYEVSYLRDDEEFLIERCFEPAGKILVLGCGAGRTLLLRFRKRFRYRGDRHSSGNGRGFKEAGRRPPDRDQGYGCDYLGLSGRVFRLCFFLSMGSTASIRIFMRPLKKPLVGALLG